jgi:uncharacterized phage protein (TIGR02218 family)
MTYLTHEASVHDSKPVELYKFIGTYQNYYYTSGPVDVDYDDGEGVQTYQAINVERTEIKAGTHEDDGLSITVTLSATHQLVKDYAFSPAPPPTLKLKVYRQQPDETVTYWEGPVNSFKTEDGNRCSVNAPSAFGAALVGNVPNVYYQTPCNHSLYDVRCKVPYEDFSLTSTVVAISEDGLVIEIGDFATLDGKLLGGEFVTELGERRMIVLEDGLANTLTVNFPFNNLTVGDDCTIAAGCDYNYCGDCKLKFNNQINFGGFRHIPPINPFIDGIEPAAEGVTDDACVFVHEPGGWFFKLIFRFDQGEQVPIRFPGMNIHFMRDTGPQDGSSDYFALANTSYGSGYFYEGGPSGSPCLGAVFYGWQDVDPENPGPIEGWDGYGTDPFAEGLFDWIWLQHQYSSGSFTGPNIGSVYRGRMTVHFQLPGGEPQPLIVQEGSEGPEVGTPLIGTRNLWPEITILRLGA